MHFIINGKETYLASNYPHKIRVKHRDRIRKEAKKLFGKYNLQDWKLQIYVLEDNALGNCDCYNKVIVISIYCLFLMDWENLKDLLLHEVAHAIMGSKHGHDKAWQDKAIEIGCNGEERHQIEDYIKIDENYCKITFTVKKNIKRKKR